MSSRIETEKKYFCINNDELLNEIEANKLKLVSKGKEIDEYFTDINSEYIRNRTCLRIRKTDDKCEVTFKGKSNDFNNSFCKLESNYEIDEEKYEDIVNLFSNLGYYSYVIVNKSRYTYEIKEDKYCYSVMVDNIEDVGDFVEFELVCEEDDYDETELRNKLNSFIHRFSESILEEASLAYRDYVALKKYNDYVPKNTIKGIHLNLDSFLKNYEKTFYNYYKNIIKDSKHINTKLQGFRENIYDIEEPQKEEIESYFDNIKIHDSKFIILFELLKQLKIKNMNIVLSTNCSEIFISEFLKKVFKTSIVDKIIYLNNNKAVYNELKKYEIDLNSYFNITKLDLKETNSLLLVIINNL